MRTADLSGFTSLAVAPNKPAASKLENRSGVPIERSRSWFSSTPFRCFASLLVQMIRRSRETTVVAACFKALHDSPTLLSKAVPIDSPLQVFAFGKLARCMSLSAILLRTHLLDGRSPVKKSLKWQHCCFTFGWRDHACSLRRCYVFLLLFFVLLAVLTSTALSITSTRRSIETWRRRPLVVHVVLYIAINLNARA